MTTITNIGTNTFSAKLKEILPKCDRIDALVGYFYFSGFRELHSELKDKKIRILVGKDIDRKILERISSLDNLDLEDYEVTITTTSRSGARIDYIDNFSKIFNDTDFFDNEESQKAFEIFLGKIQDGTLEIKKTADPDHSKFYILHHKAEFSESKTNPGVVIEGSSNLTYMGLRGQRERNRILIEKHYYDEDTAAFETAWNDAKTITIADVNSAKEFVSEIKKRIWLYKLPDPKLMYYRVLDEYFSIDEIETMRTAHQITSGRFSDLKYQKDAVNLGIDRIKRFGGVIIADVVGLGKSIIASTIAHNLNLQTVIIAPPHLKPQWEDYCADFDFKGHVYTTGEVEKALQRHGGNDKELLIVLDEAHKHRNEDTENYKALHMLCAGNKVMALSATPFNNDPKDIYALIKLFSTPGQSTIKTVENLSIAFHDLFKRYKKIRRDIRNTAKNNLSDGEAEAKIETELHSIASELRKMIEPLVIRRSRLDLEQIEDYKQDLERQGISFASVKDPELLEYDLGSLSTLYGETLEKIAPEGGSTGFDGVRYKPASYLKEGSKFIQEILDAEDDEDGTSPEERIQRITQAQTNVAGFMRRLLVRRFESSIDAFRSTLKNMITSSETMLEWHDKRGVVPIFKKGSLPSAEELEELEPEEIEELMGRLKGKGLIEIPAKELKPEFREALERDISLLKEVQADWKDIDTDPKYEFFKLKLVNSLDNDPKRKIIVFTEFSDTADYVYRKLTEDGVRRVYKYSSADASKESKETIRQNFDAGLKPEQKVDDYDVLVATDAISEGFNLHRAGTVINYDIPYNPTRVIQRVGRINRINKKVFDQLFIWNFFPTPTGERETHTRSISTLKMNLIHSLLGEDTRIFTADEDLRNYFAKKYRDEQEKTESLSWDAKYRNEWLKIKDDPEIRKLIAEIPHRARIARKFPVHGVVAFAKRNGNYVFAFGKTPESVALVSPEEALPLFDDITEGEKAHETTANFEPIYTIAKQHIFKDNTKAPITGRRKQDAIGKLKVLAEKYQTAKEMCDDIIKLIAEFDALPNGTLREIADMKMEADLGKTYERLKELVPPDYLRSIFDTAERANEKGRLIVLSEELIP